MQKLFLRIPAHAAVAAGILGQSFVEAFLREIGEERLGKVELRVGALPQQEVGQPLLTTGADHQIDRRQVTVEVLFDDLLVDGLGFQRTGLDLGGNGAGGVGQLGMAAVVQAAKVSEPLGSVRLLR